MLRQNSTTKQTTHRRTFLLGETFMTPGADDALQESGQTPLEFLRRHISGDWGELSDDDIQANEHSLRNGSRLLSAYRTAKGERIWIITEADRSSTTILLPSEY